MEEHSRKAPHILLRLEASSTFVGVGVEPWVLSRYYLENPDKVSVNASVEKRADEPTDRHWLELMGRKKACMVHDLPQ